MIINAKKRLTASSIAIIQPFPMSDKLEKDLLAKIKGAEVGETIKVLNGTGVVLGENIVAMKYVNGAYGLVVSYGMHPITLVLDKAILNSIKKYL